MYVVEGYTDVMALAQADVANVVASMGTALTEQQLGRLSRLTRNVYLCYDADAAGIGAMQRALTLGRRMNLSLHVVRIPDGLDPADYVLSGAGGDGFRALAGDAQTLLQFHVRLALATHDLDRPDGRARAFARLREVLSEAATPMERDDELRYVADKLQLSAESVRYLLSGGGRPATGPAAGGSQGAPPRSGGSAVAPGGAHELEVRFLAGCLAQPGPGREALARVDEGFFATAETRAALRRVKAAVGGRRRREHPAIGRRRGGRGRRRGGVRGGHRPRRTGAVHRHRREGVVPASAGGTGGPADGAAQGHHEE